MKLGPDPIDFGGDSAAVRDRKACEGAVYDVMRRGGYDEVQAHNGTRTYRATLLEEAAEAVADSTRRSGLGWESARDALLAMAATARSERTYAEQYAELEVSGD